MKKEPPQLGQGHARRYRHPYRRPSAFICGLILLCVFASQASCAALEWDANPPEQHVTNYLALTGIAPGYYDQSFETPTTAVDVSAVLSDGLEHYFVVYAVDDEGNISPPSAEVMAAAAQPRNITVILESADGLGAPWDFLAQYQLTVPAERAQRFFRARLKIE